MEPIRFGNIAVPQAGQHHPAGVVKQPGKDVAKLGKHESNLSVIYRQKSSQNDNVAQQLKN